MARRQTPSKERVGPALLAKPREEVRTQLLSRIEVGEEILNQSAGGSVNLAELKANFAKWDDFNVEFLRRAFTSSEYADSYSFYGVAIMAVRAQTHSDLVSGIFKRVTEKRDRLVSLVERLDLIDELPGIGSPEIAPVRASRDRPTSDNNKIFLVHGQDEEAKAVVARFIQSCGLDPIILHDQANGGRTIIEKFEREADVGFAIILLTPDDVGGPHNGVELASDELRLRARQNVILELGYFTGRLGRERVAAIKKGDIELPSDVSGVVWTSMDAPGAWKMSIARELKAAGYDFDLGKALSI